MQMPHLSQTGVALGSNALLHEHLLQNELARQALDDVLHLLDLLLALGQAQYILQRLEAVLVCGLRAGDVSAET